MTIGAVYEWLALGFRNENDFPHIPELSICSARDSSAPSLAIRLRAVGGRGFGMTKVR